VVYNILFKTAAETLLTIAADPKHLGAKLGITMVLHTWGSSLIHHPHVHCIVPGGGLSKDGQHWVSCKSGFFLPVRVLSRLFRRLFLARLMAAYKEGQRHFYGQQASLDDREKFTRLIKPLHAIEWAVYAKLPFDGPKAVLAYLSRYTHRVAIANSRLVNFDANKVTFKWKDYRRKGENQHKTMTLDTDEFIRRFLIHVLPGGFHRIRLYGLLANARRVDNVSRVRDLLEVVTTEPPRESTELPTETFVCRSCAGPMIILDILPRRHPPRAPPLRLAVG
jgi:hypothetical protein